MAQPVSFDITPEKEASMVQFFRRQFFGGPPGPSATDPDLSGKTAVVTGANGGIGVECARQLLHLGITKLILAVRDETRGKTIQKSLTNVKEGQTTEVWKLDYGSYDSIKEFALRVEELQPRVDIVILNAGINRGSFGVNPATGHEEDLQTNYISTALLTLLFLRVFKNAKATTPTLPPGRIVVVSSDTAAWAKFAERSKVPLLPSFDDKNAKWDAIERYATTKLLGQLFVTELAKRVPPSIVVVNLANPGLCYGSSIQRELGVAAAVFTRVFGHSSATGARTLVIAAAKQDGKSHGHYVQDGEIRPKAAFVYSKEAEKTARQLWEETMEELSFAGVEDILNSISQA